MEIQFDIKRIHELRDIIYRLRSEDYKVVQVDFDKHFKEATEIEILLMEQELLSGEYGITIKDIQSLSHMFPQLHNYELDHLDLQYQGHPVQIFKEENKALQQVLVNITSLLREIEQHQDRNDPAEMIAEAKRDMLRLGEFRKHYDRKEKLFFPILERYRHFAPTRIMWRDDDKVRALYKAAKYHIDRLPQTPFEHIHMTYDAFEQAFTKMIFHEETILLPILVRLFDEEDWHAVAKECDAFGYSLIDVEDEWSPNSLEEKIVQDKNSTENKQGNLKQNIPFGGGYLSTEEANLILNNLPLEITFVDKNSVFKYFNKITAASEMMLVRTPISIGRNVANCHPPKSLKKVMTLIRDLKTKKRTSESMWFKMKGKYIHLTYKALFNEAGEYLGILEYVQDIQPFLELPTEIKRGLSPLDN